MLKAYSDFLVLLLVLFIASVYSHSSQASERSELSNVRALLYSSSAVELQWDRHDSDDVQIWYNGCLHLTVDANSFFTDRLDPSQFHQFELRSVSAEGKVSEPTLISFSSENFELPIKEISSNSSIANDVAVLEDVKMKIYSNSAAELFWMRADSTRVSVEVLHNGNSLGVFSTSSIFLSQLDSNRSHQFQVRPLIDGELVGSSYVMNFNPPEFEGFVTEVVGKYQETSKNAQPQSALFNVENDSPENNDESNGPSSSTTQPPASTAYVAPPPPAPEQPSNDDPSVATTQSSIQAGDCVVRSLSDLNDCANAAQGLDRINIQADLSCTSANCCPTGGALMRFDNVSDLTIVGNGHQLLRQGGQRQCSLLDVTNSRDITIENWTLDDDARVAPCVVDDKCPRMLHIRTSSDVRLNNVTIDNGKSYVVYVQQVNGFEFTNSTLKNSGVLGMYIGHDDKASTNIKIQNSTFHDNQTNGLALLGVTGSSTSTNIVSNNEFRRNHWRGQWQVAPRYGTGFTGGGQMYIAQASGLTIRDNFIADGYCENCFIQSTMGSGVSGIELAIPGRESVSNTLITNNTVRNHDAWGIFVNQGSTLNPSVVISNNQLIDNTVGLKPGAASVSGNTINNR